jgi:hypothetical protein
VRHAPPVDPGKTFDPASATEPGAGSVALEATTEREQGDEGSEPEGLYPDFPPPPQSELGVDSGEPEGARLPETDTLPGPDVWVNQSSPAGSQQETSIAASPTDPDNLVGLFQDTGGRWAWTSDGGATWTVGAGQLSGDPAVAADGRGDFYAVGLGPIEVFKSTDGGQTFETKAVVGNGDKPYVTVDLDTDNVYVVWAEGPSPTSNLQIHFSKSTNRGRTFSAAIPITDGQYWANGALPAVGPNGEIYVVWGYADPNNRLWFDRSLDEGDTWLEADVLVATYVEPRTPLQGGFRNPLVPAIAVDRTGGPYGGRIYVVWPDQSYGDPDILLAFSDDLGDTWSAPLRVNDDVTGNDADQWFPWIVVDDSGHVHVTFLDRREDPDGYLYSMYLATSTDGGISFGPNIRVSDGLYGPTTYGFLGDYTGAAVTTDGRLFPLWPDGRHGDLDVFTRAVDLADYDEDGVLNDGNGDGQYANARCTAGQVAGCDDNCPGEPNPAQADQDGDLVGDGCDSCVITANTDQFDRDRDGIGDACDPCPDQVGGDPADADGDSVANCADNCPQTFNPGQEDGDADDLGDPCDPFPTDPDNDGVAPGSDNCAQTFNPVQADSDADGIGDLCDVCPDDYDPAQDDGDGDGRGDPCDCQPDDPNDREPAEVVPLTVDRSGTMSVVLTWSPVTGADAYSVTRGSLASMEAGQYGGCVVEGLLETQYEDSEPVPSGGGFAYLVEAQNVECGLGTSGYTSGEQVRVNDDVAACIGTTHVDVYPSDESTVTGTVTGDYTDTFASDETFESVTEVGTFLDDLEHRWSFQVAPGRRLELHVEGWRSDVDAETYDWEYSTDGGTSWNPVSLGVTLPQVSDAVDLVGPLPDTLSGPVEIRVIDRFTDSILGTVHVDELFVRTIE